MQNTLGAGATARSAGALRTRYLAASMGGRAAWPTVRHLADKIGPPFRSQDGRGHGTYNVTSGCCAK